MQIALCFIAQSAFAASPTPDFATDIQPLLTKFCMPCHGEKKKADLDLRLYTDNESARKAPEVFKKILRNLESHEMPPESRPQPTPEERQLITSWVEMEILGCDCDHPDPGRVTIRRLNRVEYNNTIRDLVGVNFQPADDFPADDVGYGFDNIGDVLSLSPLLLERYLTAAEKILDAAIVTSPGTNALPVTHTRIFFKQAGEKNKRVVAGELITSFAKRAYRRPLTTDESVRLLKFYDAASKGGEGFENAVKLSLQAVLVSPHFLFRGELQPQPDDAKSTYPVDEFALASRLSYFLWSSMPDDELFALAEAHKLRGKLESQVRRMLKDPKARALTDNFAGQWLQIRNLASVTPDAKLFPNFNESLRHAMETETKMFFDDIVQRDRSTIDFLTADYTFLNEQLAVHYGISGVKGDKFRRVSLRGAKRGGVLTQASVLTVTSIPTRTSPVKRGKWVLENILGTPPPPPPPDVPAFPEGHDVANLSLRERLEKHRADPICSSCHSRMDPIGFGLENFDAVGVWRDSDGALAIDTAGKLATGETFHGPAELKRVLAKQQRDQFINCLASKLLTYAIGRGMEYYDTCALDEITKAAAKDRYRFSALVMGIVKSAPFQFQRGDTTRDQASN